MRVYVCVRARLSCDNNIVGNVVCMLVEYTTATTYNYKNNYCKLYLRVCMYVYLFIYNESSLRVILTQTPTHPQATVGQAHNQKFVLLPKFSKIHSHIVGMYVVSPHAHTFVVVGVVLRGGTAVVCHCHIKIVRVTLASVHIHTHAYTQAHLHDYNQ